MIYAPPDGFCIYEPTARQLARIIRDHPHEYWQQGGNGEATLGYGPGWPALWIKKPEPALFFITYSHPSLDWVVPYDGGSCEALVENERGGDPFWIPRACLISVDHAVEVAQFFLSDQLPWPGIPWSFWHEVPLTNSYPRP